MWKEILLINGTIEDENGNEINNELLFKLLSDHGFCFQGSTEKIALSEIVEAVDKINEFITEDKLKYMIDRLNDFYDEEMSKEDIDLFFSCNNGTGVFHALFDSVLNDELKRVYKKYSHTDWNIADEFGVRVGDMILNKLSLMQPYHT